MADSGCPKCGTALDEARTHCRTCGLAHARMAAYEQARDAVPDALSHAWQQAIEHWDEPARHDELLRLVTQHDAWAWAAARYRDRIRDDANDAIARTQLDRVRRAAEATLTTNAVTRQAKQPEPYRNTMLFLGVMIIAIIAGLVYAMARSGGESGTPDRPLPPSTTK